MRESAQASKQLSHNLTDESSRRLAEEVSGSYEKGMSQRNEASKSFRQAEDYSNQANFTKANSSTINANHNQQFSEWLANQQADNSNGGTIGARGASHIIAAKPQEAMEYAGRYMAEKGLTPTNMVSSGSGLRSSYDKEQAHQVHPVTDENMQNVRSQASSLSNSISQGTYSPEVHVETRGSTQSTAQNSNDTIVQPKRFTDEKSINTNHHEPSSGKQILDIQSPNQAHQVHPVTDENKQNVRSQASGLSNSISQGTDSQEVRVETRGSTQSIAQNSNDTTVHPSKFTDEKRINPSHHEPSTGKQILGIQSPNQAHQVHPVTRDNLQSIRSQGSDHSPAKSSGAITREKVEAAQSQHGQAISTGSSGVLSHGAALKKDVQGEQDKGVVRRFASKGINEAKETASDAWKAVSGSGEVQQK